MATATFFTAIFPLIGLLAATAILPKVYGFIEVRHLRTGEASNLASQAAHSA